MLCLLQLKCLYFSIIHYTFTIVNTSMSQLYFSAYALISLAEYHVAIASHMNAGFIVHASYTLLYTF